MKWMIALVISACFGSLRAQRDSTKPVKERTLLFEVGSITQAENNQKGIGSYQAMAPGNRLLQHSFESFKANDVYGTIRTDFPAFFSIRLSTSLKPRRKIAPALSIGIRFGSSLFSSTTLTRHSLTRLEIYKSPSQQDSFLLKRYADSSYQFGVKGLRLMIPVGLHIVLNKSGYINFSFGIEAGPSISFGHRLEAYNYNYSYETVERITHDSTSSHGDFPGNRTTLSGNVSAASSKLKGIGYGFYIAAPLSISLRFSKRIQWLSKIYAVVSAYPAYSYSYLKYTGSNSGFNAFYTLGVGYAFKR